MAKTLKRYITLFRWSATCEGDTHEINICAASSPKEAKIKHLKQFKPHIFESGSNYTKKDIDQIIGMVQCFYLKENVPLKKEVKASLSYWFKDDIINWIEKIAPHSGFCNFSFQSYVNFS